MIEKLNKDWKEVLQAELKSPYFNNLLEKVKQEYDEHTCYPPKDKIFEAFNLTAFKDVKVVIIGQDPYHGPGQANGLSFSVNKDIAPPPSLLNIFKELNQDLDIPFPNHGDLSKWAKQGVLMLNATLTVRAHSAGSHQGLGWERFTDQVIQTISKEKEVIVFLLWGGNAKKKSKLIDASKHPILTSGHPSPLSANRGYWFGNKHFSKTNKLLESNKLPLIQWG